ncbi:MAG TPA: hypothetical protein VMM59_06520 [Thermohalobaculum sp.]|nr:hypothetical protein [Thermohalobaculum sp.]
MHDPLLALLLMFGGLGCIVGWAVCRVVTERRALRLRREADAIKHHIVRGGHLPAGLPSALAEGYLQIRWLDILANGLLGAGVVGVALATFFVL